MKMKSTIANLPTNEDALKSLRVIDPNQVNEESMKVAEVAVNDMCIVVWQNSDFMYEWYIGYVKSIENNNMCRVDHQQRVLEGSHTKWKYPKREDVQTVESEQIIKCNIQGEWDFSADSRKRLFTITNIKDIVGAFQKFIQ